MPSAAQIAKAQDEANAAFRGWTAAYDNLSRGVGGFATAALLFPKNPQVVAIAVALTDLWLAAGQIKDEFEWEKDERSSWWSEPINLMDFKGRISGTVTAYTAASIALAIALLAASPAILEALGAADVLEPPAIAGLIIGGFGVASVEGKVALDAVDLEWKTLGWPGTP